MTEIVANGIKTPNLMYDERQFPRCDLKTLQKNLKTLLNKVRKAKREERKLNFEILKAPNSRTL